MSELHTVPGEHDVTDGVGAEYFSRFGKASNNKGYYSFDHAGVHFVALVNVMNFKPNGLGGFGDDQLAWLKDDLAGRSASQPLVLFAHMPIWTIYEPWGWGTGDADQVMDAGPPLRFGDGAERPYPPDRAEGGRPYHFPHRPLDRLSAARARRWTGARPAERAAGPFARHVGTNHRFDEGDAARIGAF